MRDAFTPASGSLYSLYLLLYQLYELSVRHFLPNHQRSEPPAIRSGCICLSISSRFWGMTSSLSFAFSEWFQRKKVVDHWLQRPKLVTFIEEKVMAMTKRGDLECIMFTGLTLEGINLMSAYVDKTGDIQVFPWFFHHWYKRSLSVSDRRTNEQTAALVFSHVVPSYFRDNRVESWLYSYTTTYSLTPWFLLYSFWFVFSLESQDTGSCWTYGNYGTSAPSLTFRKLIILLPLLMSWLDATTVTTSFREKRSPQSRPMPVTGCKKRPEWGGN